MAFPDTIYEQRELENLPGLKYDRDNKKTLYAEDISEMGRELTAIETMLLAIKNELTPIGTVYINGTNNTNPAELLGFGIWEPYAEGQALAGLALTGAYSTLGAELGSDEINITKDQLPKISGSFRISENCMINGDPARPRIANMPSSGIFSRSSTYGASAWLTNSNSTERDRPDTVKMEFGNDEAISIVQKTKVAAAWIRVE